MKSFNTLLDRYEQAIEDKHTAQIISEQRLLDINQLEDESIALKKLIENLQTNISDMEKVIVQQRNNNEKLIKKLATSERVKKQLSTRIKRMRNG